MGFTTLNALEYGSEIGIFTSNDGIPKETRIYGTTDPSIAPVNWDYKTIGSLNIGNYRAYACNDLTELFMSEYSSTTVGYFQKARVLSIEGGGTGATTAEGARKNLGITSGTPEFGTFTPALGSSGTAPRVTYTEQSGVYWKLGKLCISSGRITCNIDSEGSRNGIIIGLPFTSSSDIESQNVIFSEQYSGTTTSDLAGKIEANTNYIVMGRRGSWTLSWGTGGRCYNFVAIYQIS